MKLLYISVADLPDYQSDMIFHGLRTMYGPDCVDSNEMWYMYSDLKNTYWNLRAPNNGKSYGNGFTIAGTLKNINVDRSELDYKIKNNFFDKIIYGSVHRCLDYLDLVLKHYTKKDIIFIDGEDHDNRIQHQLIDKGMYFKRELAYNDQNIFPINFCVPSELIVNDITEKCQDYATIIPGNLDTYIFNTQHDYYADYQKSYYGLTFKKGGWDCLRHYEILMNGCIPYFPGLEECPIRTMELFPKNLILNSNKILESDGLPDNYNDIASELLEYTRQFLTTTYVASNILSKTI